MSDPSLWRCAKLDISFNTRSRLTWSKIDREIIPSAAPSSLTSACIREQVLLNISMAAERERMGGETAAGCPLAAAPLPKGYRNHKVLSERRKAEVLAHRRRRRRRQRRPIGRASRSRARVFVRDDWDRA